MRGIYKAHYESIYNYIYFLTNNPHMTEDYVQETFMRFTNMQHVQNEKAVLYKIARNLVYDYSRRKKLLQWVPIIGDSYQDMRRLPEEIVEKGEDIAALYSAMSSLKLHYREVILLRYIEELSVKETAALLQLSEGQVKNYTVRGFRLLRKQLGGEVSGVEV